MELEGYITFLEGKQKELVESFCGKKSQRNDNGACVRCKTKRRTVHTKHGTITMVFAYVKNKESKSVFSPLMDFLRIGKHQRASHEFKEMCAKKASRTTYRDTSIDLMESNCVKISHTTIHTYTKEACENLVCTADPDANDRILMADGTKAHSRNCEKHDIRAVISTGNKKSLLSLTANKPWAEIAKGINQTQFAVLVGDAEPGLRHAFFTTRFHLCHKHAIRDTAFYSWKDGLTKKQYALYVSRLETILYTLQKSTKKYWIDKDSVRLLKRIETTKSELRDLVKLLASRKLFQAAEYVDRHIDHLTTAAEVAISHGIRVPWTTNTIERMMREIGKRTKKKGMCWSEAGLLRIVSMNLKRYMVPFEQRKYLSLFGDNIRSPIGVEF